jgi:hypothetical protein
MHAFYFLPRSFLFTFGRQRTVELEEVRRQKKKAQRIYGFTLSAVSCMIVYICITCLHQWLNKSTLPLDLYTNFPSQHSVLIWISVCIMHACMHRIRVCVWHIHTTKDQSMCVTHTLLVVGLGGRVYSLFGWVYQHGLSAVEQYFSLTANQT